MLQIVSKRFFRDGVELRETTHRRTLYTNGWFLNQETMAFAVGDLTGSTGHEPVMSAWVEVTEHQEATNPDGSDNILVSTSGDELIDDLADVLSFALNITISREQGLVQRLVPNALSAEPRRVGASSLFLRLFDPAQLVTTEDVAQAQTFLADLLALPRPEFLRVMRAIRRAVAATRTAAADPTSAYMDFVAALESLADPGLSAPVEWAQYDGRKRGIIDEALDGVDDEAAERVRAAILEADRTGSTSVFLSSTLARLSDDFYRGEAVGSLQPPRGADIGRMLKLAYSIRSGRAHRLKELPPEVWAVTGGAETAWDPSEGAVITLAGLWRVVRHVVRRFVTDTPAATASEPYDYRSELPGRLTMRLAARYWVWRPGLTPDTAVERFGAVVQVFVTWNNEPDEGFDLRDVLVEIEDQAKGLADGDAKLAMLGIYAIWHDLVPAELHRPKAEAYLKKYGSSLEDASLVSFVRSMLLGEVPDWALSAYRQVADDRWVERQRGTGPELPAGWDAALQLVTADRHAEAGDRKAAVTYAGRAVEEVPGDAAVMAWETALRARLEAGAGGQPFDMHALLFGSMPEADADTADPGGTDEPATEASIDGGTE